MVLVLGQEYEGLPDAARDPNDLRVKIDGTGNVAGLNISVATGVLLGEWWRQNKACALVALFRQGPLQSGMVDNFIDRKHGREEISYPDVQWQHESLKPVLEPTYGIILYQEQVMQIAQVLSGYTLWSRGQWRRSSWWYNHYRCR